jgi:DNA-binding MarR family transcriptional regulator
MKIENFLDNSPIFLLVESYNSLQKKMREVLKKEELNVLQSFILMAILLEKNSHIYPTNLVKSFKTSKGHISQAISQLESFKFVERKVCSEDARRYSILLTNKGKKKGNNLIKIFDKMQNDWENKLGMEELKSTLSQMKKLNSLISE